MGRSVTNGAIMAKDNKLSKETKTTEVITHEAFESHPHVNRVWVNQSTGEWYLHEKKGCLLIERDKPANK